MFRAVGLRCAVDFSELSLPISQDEALALLQPLGFRVVVVDIVRSLRALIGVSEYCRGARLANAPTVVDCSSLVKWVYAQRGIWLPRRSIQQIECGMRTDLSHLVAGDVIFVTGRRNWYGTDPSQGVGHVGIATGTGTVIHAANRRLGVAETTVTNFVDEVALRGVRRYVSQSSSIVTLETPPDREVETSDDIRWIVLQLMHVK